MPKLATARPLREKERELLEFMLSVNFPGRDVLKSQADRVEVCAECDCGCGTVDLQVHEPFIRAAACKPIPVEAYRDALEVMLFVRHGALSSLEIVHYLDTGPPVYPTPNDLKLWVPPSRKAEEEETKKAPS